MVFSLIKDFKGRRIAHENLLQMCGTVQFNALFYPRGITCASSFRHTKQCSSQKGNTGQQVIEPNAYDGTTLVLIPKLIFVALRMAV